MRERLARVLGSEVVSLEQVRGRGYTAAGRFRIELADGRRVFVKLAVEELTAGWLREEHLVYSQVSAPFIPELLGWDDDGLAPLLVLPDLGDAFDAPPWTDAKIAAVEEALDALWATRPPDDLPSAARFAALRERWDSVAAEPEPFLSLRLCSPDWLDENLPALRAAAHEAELEGDDFIHLDVRSDNLAFVEGRALLVDWNWASRGNRHFDLAGWLPSLYAEGGAEPDERYDGPPELAALLAGIWAYSAGRPPPPTADPSLRAKQVELLQAALPWACRLLNLPPPDGG